MASLSTKREMEDPTDCVSSDSSVILCLPPPFKHKKVRAATSTTTDDQTPNPDVTVEVFDGPEKRGSCGIEDSTPLTHLETRINRKVRLHQSARVSTQIDEDPDVTVEVFEPSQKRLVIDESLQSAGLKYATPEAAAATTSDEASENFDWQSRMPNAPSRPRTSSPVNPSLYNSYFDDDWAEDVHDAMCDDCSVKGPVSAAQPTKTQESLVGKNHPHVKRLLQYDSSDAVPEDIHQAKKEDVPKANNEGVPKTDKKDVSSKVVAGGTLEYHVKRLKNKQTCATPRPGGLKRPKVIPGARAVSCGAGHGAGPRFARHVSMYTDRPGVAAERRDKYSGIKRGAVFHAEMSNKKHLILKK